MIRSVLHNLSITTFANKCNAKCPVCGLPALGMDSPGEFDNAYFACRRCGGFKTPYDASDVANYCKNANVSELYGRGLISYYIQKEWLAIDAQCNDYDTSNIHYANLDREKLVDILQRPLPSINEQIAGCMQVIASEKCANGRFRAWGFGGELGESNWWDLFQQSCQTGEIDASAEKLMGLDQFYLEIIRILCATRIDEIEYFFRKCLCEEEQFLDYIPPSRAAAIGERKFDLARFVITTKGWKFLDGREVGGDSRSVFVAMWFAEFTRPLREVIRKVLLDKGYDPVFVDELPTRSNLTLEQRQDLAANSTIDDMIIANIRRAKFVIADLSCFPGEKMTSAIYKKQDGTAEVRDIVCAGAYFEAGYATALEKPIIYFVHQKQTPHFDVNHIPYITWSEGALDELEVALRSATEARGL